MKTLVLNSNLGYKEGIQFKLVNMVQKKKNKAKTKKARDRKKHALSKPFSWAWPLNVNYKRNEWVQRQVPYTYVSLYLNSWGSKHWDWSFVFDRIWAVSFLGGGGGKMLFK
mgnify:CR=1 FL=1